MLHEKRIVIIGAGIGGLTAAIELAAEGYAVTVLEQAATPGGKMRQVSVGGYAIDAGPTVLTMRWVFEELFERAGTSLEAELSTMPAEIIARHAWDDRGHLDLFADLGRSAAAIESFSGAGEGKRFLAFMREASNIHRTLKDSFISNSRTSLLGLSARVTKAGNIGGWLRLNPYTSLWQALGKHFRDPRLQQLFGRYATYAGSSPYLAPATLMLIAHVEQEGVWLVEGGMYRLAEALAQLAVRLGVQIRYGARAAEIITKGGRATGVRMEDSEQAPIDSDAIVVNADINAFAAGLFGKDVAHAVKPTPEQHRSLSALTWNLVARTSGFPLVRHSVFFSRAYAREFEEIFKRRRLPTEPTVYICAQDRGASDTDHSAQPTIDRLLLLVNAPPFGDRQEIPDEAVERCYTATRKLLERCGLSIHDPADTPVATGPSGFERLFPATGGALYGRASHGWQASFNRPAARSGVPGVYLAGGSAHPGAGVPMAALSGRQAANAVLEDFGRRRNH